MLAAGRPVLFVGDRKGELAMCIEQAGCGRAFSVGAAADPATAIRQLASQPALLAEMGERARALWAARFKRQQALATWQALLTKLSPGTR